MNLLGVTYGEHNPDSWEGWHWGGMHMWGFSHRLGHPGAVRSAGRRPQEHRDDRLLVGGPGEHGRRHLRRIREHAAPLLAKELGVKMVFIDPYFNHTAGLFGDKWFAPRPRHRRGLRTRHRLHLADRRHLRQGVCRHPHHGFDEWKDYVLGTSDGRPKTPEWAASEMRHPRPGDPGARPGMGRRRRRCSPPAARAAWAAPAARRPATSGRGP